MKSRSPRRRALGAAFATLLLAGTLAACGDDAESPSASESTSQSDSPSPSPSEETSESPGKTPGKSPDKTPERTPSKSQSEDSGPTLEVEVEGDEVKPVAEQVDLSVGEGLTITVTSNRAGELHVHSDPEHSFEFGPGTETFDLTIDTPGSVDIEEHESDALVARLLVR